MPDFDFGQNWEAYSRDRLSIQQLDEAVRSLQLLLSPEGVTGRSFLDVGCGSGLFSIAATRLGAARTVGIDVNPRCVAVSEDNRRRLAPAAVIEFRQASALDADALATQETFDPYASLDHTGQMWQYDEW